MWVERMNEEEWKGVYDGKSGLRGVVEGLIA